MSLQSRVMTVQMCIGFAVSLAVFAAICGVALLVLAAVRRVWSSKLLQTQMHSSRAGMQISANPRPDADVYADLFDSDLDTVAVTVSKMWPRQAN